MILRLKTYRLRYGSLSKVPYNKEYSTVHRRQTLVKYGSVPYGAEEILHNVPVNIVGVLLYFTYCNTVHHFTTQKTHLLQQLRIIHHRTVNEGTGANDSSVLNFNTRYKRGPSTDYWISDPDQEKS